MSKSPIPALAPESRKASQAGKEECRFSGNSSQASRRKLTEQDIILAPIFILTALFLYFRILSILFSKKRKFKKPIIPENLYFIGDTYIGQYDGTKIIQHKAENQGSKETAKETFKKGWNHS
jgi:hypothetical protein